MRSGTELRNSTTAHTVIMNQDGIPNNLSSDCATLVPISIKDLDSAVDEKQQSLSLDSQSGNPTEASDQLVK